MASGIKLFPEVSQTTPKQHFSKSSQITVPAADFEKNTYTCIVKHPAIADRRGEQKRIEKRDCAEKNPEPIQVRLLTPGCDAENTETNLELVCILLGSGSGEVEVESLINGVVVRPKVKVTLRGKQGNGYSSFIKQNVTQKSWDGGDRYTFRVTRLPGIQNIELYNTSKCEACYKSMQAPTVSITKPSYRDLVEGTAAVTCLVEGFFLGNIQITWNVNSRPSSKPQAEIVKTQSGGHENAQSSHSVSLEQWKKGTRFQCKVATMCLEEITKEVTIKQEAHIPTTTPIVTISQTYREESSNSTIGQILVCDVSGFSPVEISLSWKKNSTLLNSSLYDNGPMVPSGNGYVTYSILKIGRSEGGNGRDIYTCVVHHSSSPKPITADKMISSDIPKPQAPTVALLQSIDPEKKIVILNCVASDYWPEKVAIDWKGSLQRKDVKFTEQKMANGRYTASSQLEVTISLWQEADSNACEVVHKESNSTSLKRVSRKDWIMPTPLRLSLSTNPPCPGLGLSNSNNITLLCSINGYLEGIKIIWEAAGQVPKTLKTERYQGKGDQYYTSSNLTVPLKEWNKLQEYTCKVTPLEKNITQVTRISKCTACKGSIPPPSLYLLKPSLEGLLIRRKALLTCLVVGYELDHGIFTWMVGGVNKSENNIRGDLRNHKNKTQTLESQLVISQEAWDSGIKVQCIFSHSCTLFAKKEEAIQNVKDPSKIKAPSLSWVTPSPMQLMSPTSQAVSWVECVVSGFFPAEILFRWKKNGSYVDASEYTVGSPVAKDGSLAFTTQSILKIPSSEWESRTLYTCMVGHESSTDMYNLSQILYDVLEPASPQVMAFHTSEKEARHKLVCFATGFHPKTVDIRWSAPGMDLSCSADSSALVALSDRKFQKSCNLALSEEQWRMPKIYTCTVNHSSTNTSVKKILHSAGMVSPPTNSTVIDLQPPPFEDLFINNSAALTCTAPLADTRMNLTVMWLMDGQPADTPAVTTEVLSNSTNTSWIHSQLVVTLTQWKATIKFICSITTGLGEVTQFYKRRNGTMKPPKVYLQQQTSQEDLNVTLLCAATDFYPEEVFMKWQEQDTMMPLTGPDAQDLKCDHERERCSLFSILEVPRRQWMMGISYTCLVAHVSSANIIIRRASSHSVFWDYAVTGAEICGICNETEEEYSQLTEMDGAWNRVSTYLILFLLALFYGGLVTFFKVK